MMSPKGATCQYPQRDTNNIVRVAGCFLQIATKRMLQSYFPVKNKLQTMFPPIFIPNKHNPELKTNVDQMNKKLNFLRFIDFFMFQ